MAFVDDAVFVAATGYIYTAPIGTEADITDFDPDSFGLDDSSGWDPVGYTSEENLPEFGYEGGDSESRGSWQRKNMRQVSTENPVDYVTFQPQQITKDTLEMYYGPNASVESGRFGIDISGRTIDRAILIVLVDGENVVGFTAPKTSIGREESIGLATDDFATFPVRSTFEKMTGKRLFEWILPGA